eukprot:Gb_04132 [translate_table: standard]
MVSEDNHEGTPLHSTKPKYRHEYYQKPNEVVVTMFAKGLSGYGVHIEFGEQFLSVIIEVPREDKYALQKHLFAKIIPEKCKYAILTTKIEIHLAKAQHINWASLEYNKKQGVLPKQAFNCQMATNPWSKLLSQYLQNPHVNLCGPIFTIGRRRNCNLTMKDSC